MTDLQDRTALVTGGTDGIGKEIARGLARDGVAVIVVGRDALKGLRAVEDIRASTGNKRVEFVSADLSLMSESFRLTDDIAARWPRLSYLVHSAGIVRGRWELTSEGIESNFAVNFLSRFTVTTRLLPMLKKAARPGEPARILLVGGAAQLGKINFENVNLKGTFTTPRAVLQFQCANDVFAVELARRLAVDAEGRLVNVNVVKYGPVKTNVLREAPRWLNWFAAISGLFVGQTASEAAGAALSLLLDPEFADVTGSLFLNMIRFRQIALRRFVADPAIGRRLWEVSEKLQTLASLGGLVVPGAGQRLA